jgi:hypothetical protein
VTRSNGRGTANDAEVVVGDNDNRTDEERAAAERAALEETVTRLTTKRDKAEQHLDDAEAALAEAKDQLKEMD